MQKRKEIYNLFVNHSVSGLDFCLQIDSKQPGPHSLFLLSVDGREQSATEIVSDLYREHLAKEFFIKKGKVSFVLANAEAFLYNQPFIEEDLNNAFWYTPNNTYEGRRASEIRNFLIRNQDVSNVYRIFPSLYDREEDLVYLSKEQQVINLKDLKKAKFRHQEKSTRLKVKNLEKTSKDNPQSSLINEIENFGADFLVTQIGTDKNQKSADRIYDKYEQVIDHHHGIYRRSNVGYLWWLLFLLLLLLILLLLCLFFVDCRIKNNLYRPYLITKEERLDFQRLTLPNLPSPNLTRVKPGNYWNIRDEFYTNKPVDTYEYNGSLYLTGISYTGETYTIRSQEENLYQNPNWEVLNSDNQENQRLNYGIDSIILDNQIVQASVDFYEENVLIRSSKDGQNYTDWSNKNLPDLQTSTKVSLASFNEKIIILAINKENKKLYQSESYDLETWSNWQEVFDQTVKVYPNQVVINNTLYQYIISDSDNKIYQRSTEDNSIWTEWSSVSITIEDTEGLATSNIEGLIYQSYISDFGVVYERSSKDMKFWSQWEPKTGSTNFKQISSIIKYKNNNLKFVIGGDGRIYYREFIEFF